MEEEETGEEEEAVEEEETVEEEEASVVRASACLLIFSFSSFTLNILRLLRCVTLGDGAHVLYYAGSRQCGGTGHWVLVGSVPYSKIHHKLAVWCYCVP